MIIKHGHLATAVGKTGPWLPLNLMAFGHTIPLACLESRIPVQKCIVRVLMGWHDLGLGVGQEIMPVRQPEREEKTSSWGVGCRGAMVLAYSYSTLLEGRLFWDVLWWSCTTARCDLCLISFRARPE